MLDVLRIGIEGQAGFDVEQTFTDEGQRESAVDLRTRIREAVEVADVFLVVIGPRWLTASDDDGRRSLDDPEDVVRIESEVALERLAQRHDLLLLAILVDGATMPSPQELPPALANLARRTSIELIDEHWRSDSERLFTLLKKLERERERTQRLARLRSEAERERQEPGTVLEPAMLRRSLAAAALHGCVAATSTRPVTSGGPVTITAGGSISAAQVAGHDRFASVSRRDDQSFVMYDLDHAAAARSSRVFQLLLLGVPLVLLAGVAVAAKWLFGWFVDAVDEPDAADLVECTVFAPPCVAPGDSILVQAFVHLPEEAADARALALEFDLAAQARTFRTLTHRVHAGSRLDLELRMPGVEIDDPVASLVWHRKTEAVQFGVRVPPGLAPTTLIGTLTVSLDSAPLGHIKFKLAVEADARPSPSEPQGATASRYRVAFISYSSKDRNEVLRRVQVLELMGVKYFQDLLTLTPGDRFERRIEFGIDECDLFLLFWSRDAKASEWVRKEVGHALARKAGDDLSPPEIRPVILDGPPIVEPWDELAHLHFNDRVLYFMSPPDK